MGQRHPGNSYLWSARRNLSQDWIFWRHLVRLAQKTEAE